MKNMQYGLDELAVFAESFANLNKNWLKFEEIS